MSPPAAVPGRRAALSGLLVVTVVLYPLLDRVIIPPQHSTLHAVTDAMITQATVAADRRGHVLLE